MIPNHSQLTVIYPSADHKRGFLMATTARGSELHFKDFAWSCCAHFNRDSALNYRNIYRNFFNYMATPLHPLRRMGCRGVSRHKMHAVTRHKMHVENYPVVIDPAMMPSQDARGQLCSSTAQPPPHNLPAAAARHIG